MYLRATSVIVVLLSFAVHQPARLCAEIKVTGPDSKPVGYTCLFQVEGLPSEKPQVDLLVVPADGQFLSLYDANGSPVGVFSSDKEGRYTCVLTYVVDGKMGHAFHTVTIGATPPPIPPTPVPPTPVPPTPDPVIPDGRLGYTKMAYTEALKIPAANRVKAVALADNFESVASTIAAGAVKTVDEANALMVTKNRAALTDAERPIWLPFFTSWQAKTDALLKEGALKPTVVDYQSIYESTGQGLRRVK